MSVEFSSIIANLQDPDPRLSPKRPPRKFLNLASRTHHPRPYCPSQECFKLIDELAYKERFYATKSLSKIFECISGNHIITDFKDRLEYEKQRVNFVSYGEGWKPGPGGVPVLALFPGDTLIMIAGDDNVHATITMEDCYMTGGMFWKSRNINIIFIQILSQKRS